MKQKHSKRSHSFHLAGAMMLVSLPYTATAVYASEETEIVESIDETDLTNQTNPSDTNQPMDEVETTLNNSENNTTSQPVQTDLPEEAEQLETSSNLDQANSETLSKEEEKKIDDSQEVQPTLPDSPKEAEEVEQPETNDPTPSLVESETSSNLNQTNSTTLPKEEEKKVEVQETKNPVVQESSIKEETTNQETLNSALEPVKELEVSTSKTVLNNTSVSTQSVEVSTNSLQVQAADIDLTSVIEVPLEGMVIDEEKGIFYGISEDWYNQINPESLPLHLSLTVPASIEKIVEEGLSDISTAAKVMHGCVGVEIDQKGSKYILDTITFSNTDSADGRKLSPIIEVPVRGMFIENGIYRGISTAWYEEINPGGSKVLTPKNKTEAVGDVGYNDWCLRLSLTIPDSVAGISAKGFFEASDDNHSKQQLKFIASKMNTGDWHKGIIYRIVEIDFSKATNLQILGNSAAAGCSWLTSVIDLSNTHIKEIPEHAFAESGITGIILPENLDSIGYYAFNKCRNLAFVRTAGGDDNSSFELPKNLNSLGSHCFADCTGLPENTTVTIPASVEIIGPSAFYYDSLDLPKITTIFVKRNSRPDSLINYDPQAFTTYEKSPDHNFGVGKRLVVFENIDAHTAYLSLRSKYATDYLHSHGLTYKYTLIYDGLDISQTKLWGQPVTVCEKEDGNWFIDENYEIPEPLVDADFGFASGWIFEDTVYHNNIVLTEDIILKPHGDQLILSPNIDIVLQDPIIRFIVDGKIIECEGTHLKLNLSSNEEHTIGVKVSHPLLESPKEDMSIEFEYSWIRISKGKQDSSTSGIDLTDSTIQIVGRGSSDDLNAGYSYTDSRQGYYLVQIFGYLIKDGAKEENPTYSSPTTQNPNTPTKYSSTPSNQAYTVEVAFYDYDSELHSTTTPTGDIYGQSVVYGYTEANIHVEVNKETDHSYQYQWYEVPVEVPYSSRKRSKVATLSDETELDTSNWKKLEGETSESLQIASGKDAGDYNYYLVVTASKNIKDGYVNPNYETKAFLVLFKVNKAQSEVQISADDLNKSYNGIPVDEVGEEINGNPNKVVHEWYTADGTKLDSAPLNAGTYTVIASVAEGLNFLRHSAEATFTISKVPSKVEFLTQKEELEKVYDQQDVSALAIQSLGENTNEIVYTWYEYDGENWVQIDQAPTDAGTYGVVASIDADTNHEGYETQPLEFIISKATPNPKVQLLTIKQGNELSSLELPEGFAWIDGNEKANELGIHFFNATFTPNDTRNYEVLDVGVPVNVVMDMVALNQAPTIEAKDITLPFGQEFTNDIALQDVKANDVEDGDLTDKIEVVQNTVDPSKAGIYSVTYKVTDKDGASATKTITVTVNPKVEEIVNEAPRIDAQDMILMVGDSFDPKHGVSATDKEDGDLTNKIEVIQNTVDPSKAGIYSVTYKVTDKNGASTTKTINVTVNPKVEETVNEVPRIDAQDMILMVGDSFDPKHGVSATDKEDGDLTDKIEVVQNTVDSLKAGIYSVTYKVTDKDGASTTKTITVTIKAVEEKPTKPDDNSSTDSEPTKPNENNGTNDDPNKTDPVPVAKPNKVDSIKPNKVNTAISTVTKPKQNHLVSNSNQTENVVTSSLLEEKHLTATKESPHTAVESIQSTSSFAWSLAALPFVGKIKAFLKRKRKA